MNNFPSAFLVLVPLTEGSQPTQILAANGDMDGNPHLVIGDQNMAQSARLQQPSCSPSALANANNANGSRTEDDDAQNADRGTDWFDEAQEHVADTQLACELNTFCSAL